MAWISLLKASLPYLTQIVTAAIPAFTSKLPNEKPDIVIPKQISELQAAVTHNASSVKTLATELKETIEGIDTAATDFRRELKAMKRIAGMAIVMAILSLIFSLWVIFSKV